MIHQLTAIASKSKRLIPLGFLYCGRIGTAAIGLIIMPWFSKIMPSEQFGLAVTVLSLQSFALVLDLGQSIKITRELPALKSENACRNIVQKSERVLINFYVFITLIVLMLSAFKFIIIPISTVLLICLSMLLIVWQQIIIIAFVSRQRFIASTVIQFMSLLLRFCTALLFLYTFNNSIEMFVLGQLVGTIFILLISRIAFFVRNNSREKHSPAYRSNLSSNIAVIIYTLAGASALQLDKVLLSSFATPSFTGAYFLASMLSIVPITFFASPISQFIQPKFIKSLEGQQDNLSQRWIVRLTLAIIFLAVIPGLIMASISPLLVSLWLPGSPYQADVSHYMTLLMPGISIGALGLVPTIALIAKRDYYMLAWISVVLTIGVLSATAIFSMQNDIGSICIAYAMYHCLAAVALWWRAWKIEPNFAKSFGF